MILKKITRCEPKSLTIPSKIMWFILVNGLHLFNAFVYPKPSKTHFSIHLIHTLMADGFSTQRQPWATNARIFTDQWNSHGEEFGVQLLAQDTGEAGDRTIDWPVYLLSYDNQLLRLLLRVQDCKKPKMCWPWILQFMLITINSITAVMCGIPLKIQNSSR